MSESKRSPSEPRFVVGIGASAGGLEALRPVVRNLPERSGLAYLIAQHASPQHRSLMVELLSRETNLRVVEATSDARIEADTVYITPPSADITVDEDRIRLHRPAAEIGPKPSVDRFFASLAEAYGERALGVILSGTGSDGAHGMRAIKAAGGICIAQDPDTAKYDSMPRAAMRASATELVLPPPEIGARLEHLAKSERPPVVVADGALADGSMPTLRTVIDRIHSATGTDFTSYKEATLGRQLERRMLALQIPDLEAYVRYIDDHPDEIMELYRSFLISVTAFFRDPGAFHALEEVVRQLVASKQNDRTIRVWVPGCATGEEVYSLAILIAEAVGHNLMSYDIKLFGTDIDDGASDLARRGLYPEAALGEVDPAIVSRYFVQIGRSYQISKQIRDMVVFARHDLVQDPPFLRLDLISCRNLLIYFKNELQERVFQIFHYALRQDGYLFLGKSEALGHSSQFFSVVDSHHKIFRRRSVARSQRVSFTNPSLRVREGPTPAQRTPPGRHRTELLREQLLLAYAPPTILIGARQQLLHIVGAAGRFLRYPEGDVSMDALDLMRPEIRTECRALIHRVGKSRQSASSLPITINLDKGPETIRLVARPIWLEQESEDATLVSFEDAPSPQLVPPRPAADGDGEQVEPYVQELEHELASTKEHLQAVIEELETSNEELQSLNEELQASAEELQSSNEELETTNEELQATNEELSTVNEELQVKTNELSETNADLENVQQAISLAVIVVDADMRVRRFTPPAVRLFGLIEHDLGQRLDTVPRHVRIPNLEARIREVVAKGKLHREEVAGQDTRYFLQVAPYRDILGSYTGAVLTFADVTMLHQAQSAEAKTKERFNMITESLQEVVWMASPDLERMLYVSPRYAHVWGLDPASLIDDAAPFFTAIHDEDRARVRARILDHEAGPWSLRYRVVQPSGVVRWVRDRGEHLREDDGVECCVVGAAWDITDVVEAERRLEAAERRYHAVFDASVHGIVLIDEAGKIEAVNPAFELLVGRGSSDLVGERFERLVVEAMRPLAAALTGAEPVERLQLSCSTGNGQIVDLVLRGLHVGGTQAGLPHTVVFAARTDAPAQSEA